MTNKYFPSVNSWKMSDEVLKLSLIEMARTGASGSEGIALWLGTRIDGIVTVTHVVGLRGAGIQHHPLRLDISPQLMNDVADLAIELGLALVGQIHAHPGNFVALSDVDRTYGIAVPGYLSVVAPHYATRPGTSLEDCGVYVFEPRSGYRCMAAEEMRSRVEINNHVSCSIVFAGG